MVRLSRVLAGLVLSVPSTLSLEVGKRSPAQHHTHHKRSGPSSEQHVRLFVLIQGADSGGASTTGGSRSAGGAKPSGQPPAKKARLPTNPTSLSPQPTPSVKTNVGLPTEEHTLQRNSVTKPATKGKHGNAPLQRNSVTNPDPKNKHGNGSHRSGSGSHGSDSGSHSGSPSGTHSGSPSGTPSGTRGLPHNTSSTTGSLSCSASKKKDGHVEFEGGDGDYSDGCLPTNVVKDGHTFVGNPDDPLYPMTNFNHKMTDGDLHSMFPSMPFPDDFGRELPLPEGGPNCFRSALLNRPYQDEKNRCVVKKYSDLAGCLDSSKGYKLIILDNLTVPPKTTLTMNLKGQTVWVKGTVLFQKESGIDFKAGKHSKWGSGAGERFMKISGTEFRITGEAEKGQPFGSFVAQGEYYWDGMGSNSSAIMQKPKFFNLVSVRNALLDHLTFTNSPVQFIAIDTASQVQLQEIRFDNKDGDKTPNSRAARNTDCVDVSKSTDISINRCVCWGQDDMVAAHSVVNICATNSYALGTHGFAAGSLQNSDEVVNYYVANNVLIKPMFAFRVKFAASATGVVKGFNIRNNHVFGATNAILALFQDYQNGKPGGKLGGASRITGLSIVNNQGHGAVVARLHTNQHLLLGDVKGNKFQGGMIQGPHPELNKLLLG